MRKKVADLIRNGVVRVYQDTRETSFAYEDIADEILALFSDQRAICPLYKSVCNLAEKGEEIGCKKCGHQDPRPWGLCENCGNPFPKTFLETLENKPDPKPQERIKKLEMICGSAEEEIILLKKKINELIASHNELLNKLGR